MLRRKDNAFPSDNYPPIARYPDVPPNEYREQAYALAPLV